MAKRRRKRTRKPQQKSRLVPKRQLANWIDQATDQMMREDYPGVVQTCQRILHYAPPKSKERGDALEYLAGAYSMLNQFEEACQTLSQVLEINPHQAYLWYNRGLTGRYTMRLVQAVRDFEKAVELETDPQQRQKFVEMYHLNFSW